MKRRIDQEEGCLCIAAKQFCVNRFSELQLVKKIPVHSDIQLLKFVAFLSSIVLRFATSCQTECTTDEINGCNILFSVPMFMDNRLCIVCTSNTTSASLIIFVSTKNDVVSAHAWRVNYSVCPQSAQGGHFDEGPLSL